VHACFVSVDDGTLGPQENHRRAWQHLATTKAAFGVVLEDDCLPVAGFLQQLPAVLDAAPTDVVSLYLGTGRPRHLQKRIGNAVATANAERAHWIVGDRLLHGVAICIRTNLVASMLEATEGTDRPIDYAIRDWANAHQHPIGFCVPSLVDHRDGPTLVNHPDGEPRTQPRIAWRTGTRHHWTSKMVNL
jgi:hypothetical protein